MEPAKQALRRLENTEKFEKQCLEKMAEFPPASSSLVVPPLRRAALVTPGELYECKVGCGLMVLTNIPGKHAQIARSPAAA